MRELVLDTETTGFDPQQGDRIVEIGAVELINQMPTGVTYHQYINPERAMPNDAFEVHGLGDDFLRDKPVFKQIAQEFLDFVKDDKMVIHNAAFDMKFLNAELGWLNMKQLPWEQALDTLAIARKRFPIPRFWRKCIWNCWAGVSRVSFWRVLAHHPRAIQKKRGVHRSALPLFRQELPKRNPKRMQLLLKSSVRMRFGKS